MRVSTVCILFGLGAITVPACIETDSNGSGEGGEAGDTGDPGTGGSATSTGGQAGADGAADGVAGDGSSSGGVGGESAAPTAGQSSSGVGGASGPTESGGTGNTDSAPPAAGQSGSGGGAPETCSLLEKTEHTSGCRASYLCGSRPVNVTCGQGFIGVPGVPCDCADENYHAVDGVVGFEACEVMTTFCANPRDPQFGPEECTQPPFTDPIDTCNVDRTCVRSFTTANGAEGTLTKEFYRYIECTSTPVAGIDCNCRRQHFELDETSSETCNSLLDACDDPELGLEQPEHCEDLNAPVITETSCNVAKNCTRNIDAEGLVRREYNSRRASCSTTSRGDSSCSCLLVHGNDEFDFVQFHTDLPAGDVNTCDRLADACLSAREVDFDGAVECFPFSATTSAERCNVAALCTKQGMLGNESVGGNGDLEVSCDLDVGRWNCACKSTSESRTESTTTYGSVEVQASNSSEACAAALERCPEVTEITYGFSVARSGTL